MYHLSQEKPDDWWEVEALYDLCFAPGREALSSYRLRDDVDPVSEICLIARDGEDILSAAIRFWPVRVANKRVLLLGPIAVHPTRQGEGLGRFLIDQSLGKAAALGWRRALLVGDAPYYQRMGFEKLTGVSMPPPTNPDRVLGRELQSGSWSGLRGTVTSENERPD